MKNKMVLCSLFGLVGIAGILLNSKQLMAFLLFFLLLVLIPLKLSSDFSVKIQKSVRNSFVFALWSSGTVFLFSAILAKVPSIIGQMQFDILLLILVQASSWCFVLTLAVFILQILFFALTSNAKESRRISKNE